MKTNSRPKIVVWNQSKHGFEKAISFASCINLLVESVYWSWLKFLMKVSSFKHNCSTFLELNKIYFCYENILKGSCFIYLKIALLGNFFFSRIIKIENPRCENMYVDRVQQCIVKCVAETWANLTFSVDTGWF